MDGIVPRGWLTDKTAIVTGGAQGIGTAIAERFATEGARVALFDIDVEQGPIAAARITGPAGQPLFVHCDVADDRSVGAAVRAVEESLGPVDVLVNNAGISAYYDATQMREQQWDQVFAVDLKGVWLCCKYVLPEMRRRARGSIVNISSIHSRMTTRGMFPYAAAKAGVLGLTRSLALDEGPRGIRVNAICPGYVRTRLVQEYFDHQPDPAASERAVLDVHPLGRISTPAEIANVAAFLASDEASAMTGAEVLVDGGLSAKFDS